MGFALLLCWLIRTKGNTGVCSRLTVPQNASGGTSIRAVCMLGSGDEAVRRESRAVIRKVKKYRSKEGVEEGKGEYSRSEGQGEGWTSTRVSSYNRCYNGTGESDMSTVSCDAIPSPLTYPCEQVL